MKKIISLILMIAMLISVSAFAEEFTLHSGTNFGMSAEEIIELEKSNGFDLQPRNITNNDEDYKLAGSGVVAARKAEIEYFFTSNQLEEMRYTFHTDDISANEISYLGIENLLITKYGETEFSSKTGYRYSPTKFEGHYSFVVLPDSSQTISSPYYSQRIISTESGRKILIDHRYSVINKGTHTLSYVFLTDEMAALLENNTAAAIDDL